MRVNEDGNYVAELGKDVKYVCETCGEGWPGDCACGNPYPETVVINDDLDIRE